MAKGFRAKINFCGVSCFLQSSPPPQIKYFCNPLKDQRLEKKLSFGGGVLIKCCFVNGEGNDLWRKSCCVIMPYVIRRGLSSQQNEKTFLVTIFNLRWLLSFRRCQHGEMGRCSTWMGWGMVSNRPQQKDLVTKPGLTRLLWNGKCGRFWLL